MQRTLKRSLRKATQNLNTLTTFHSAQKINFLSESHEINNKVILVYASGEEDPERVLIFSSNELFDEIRWSIYFLSGWNNLGLSKPFFSVLHCTLLSWWHIPGLAFAPFVYELVPFVLAFLANLLQNFVLVLFVRLWAKFVRSRSEKKIFISNFSKKKNFRGAKVMCDFLKWIMLYLFYNSIF